MTVTVYDRRDDAMKAARRILKEANVKDPLVGVHFAVEQDGAGWVWHEMSPSTGQTAAGERLADGAAEGGFKSSGGVCLSDIAEEMSKPKESRDQARLRKIREADERNAQKAAAPARAPREPRTFKEPGARKPAVGRLADLKAAAERGEVPPAPDFSAATNDRYRKRFERVREMVEAGDIDGLMADDTPYKGSSRTIIARYRDMALTALAFLKEHNNGGPVHVEPQQPEA